MKVKVSCRVVAKNDTPLYLLKKHLNSIEAVQNFVPFENIKGVSNQTLLLCMQQRQNGCRLNTLAFQRTLLYINLNRQIWRVKIHMSNRKLLHLIQEKTIWWFPQNSKISTKKYGFDRIDGAICSAADIQNKCDCTLIFLDGISQLLNSQQFSDC